MEQTAQEGMKMRSIKMRFMTTEEVCGVCPECGEMGGYLDVGIGQWGYCKEHQTKWPIGIGMLERQCVNEGDQEAAYDEIGMGDFRKVVPMTPEVSEEE